MAQHRSPGARDLIITYIKGDGRFLKFWALPLNGLDTIKNFEKHFFNLKNELDTSCGFSRSELIPVGFKCAVNSKIKQRWCRARVLTHQSYTTILVQLMDYGNEEIISVHEVRSVDDQILSIPPQAAECILADVMPNRGSEWSPEAISFCEQHLLYKTLSCYVVSEYMKIPVVRIAIKGETEAFVQRLINGGLAQIKQETPSPPTQSPLSLTYKMNNMDQNAPHLVKVSCVESPQKFYVQLSVAEMELKRLMDSINRLPRESLTAVKVPAVHTPCLAQLSSKPCLYRALIIFIQQNRCKVFFVDYGYTELKDIQDLRAIPPTYLNLPAQAICCSLPREAIIDPEEFKRLINFDHLECHVLSRTTETYIVKLLCRGQDLLSPQSYVQPKLNLGAKCEVCVSYVNDLKEFYCQLTHFKDQQSSISSILNSGYNFVPISFSECTPGKPVCVKFSQDDMWYRAKIAKVNHESDIEVFFVDFGNYDNVNLNDIKKIGPDALKFPIQAFKCYLFETPLPTDSKAIDDAFDLFEELTTDQYLLARIDAISGDSGYGITLYSKNLTISINEKLQSTFLSVSTVPVNDIETVFVTSFDSVNSFFVQFEKLDSDKLSQMQEEINTFYAGSENKSFIPKEGSLVCARFNADEQFYRGKVEKCRDGLCKVFFIDYGNRESIPIKDVHSVDISFAKYPQFGTECAFENCPSETLNDKLSCLMLENSIQVKMIRKDDDKWYVSLVENFPGNVPILELLRQHEAVTPRSIHGAGLGGYQEKLNPRASHTDSWDNEKKVGYISNRNEVMKQYNHEYQEKKVCPLNSEPVNEEFEDYCLISIPQKACRNVYVSHVISPSEFYCQIEEDSSKLEQLMETIQKTYAAMTDTLNFSKFVIDSPCVMSKDGTWYRGKIKKVGFNSCDIFFVDYGNTATISNSEIKKLRSNLFRWPSQAVHCKSYNISPKGKDWNEDEINAFINMTLEKSFVAQFVDCDSNGVYAVNLVNIGKLEHDVFNKEFVNLGFGRLQDPSKFLILNSNAATSNLSFSTLSVEVGSTETVEVTYGLNPGEIFCQLKSYANNFKQMMINLQGYYNKINETESIIDRPYQGMICVAQFFLDSAWYRAEIKKVEANKIVVFYVDYGNSETVDRKKVRCIIQDYTTLPMQAIKCRIRGINSPGKSWNVNNNLGKYFEGDAVCKFISKEEDFFLVDITCNEKDVAQSLISDGLAVSDSPNSQFRAELPRVNKPPQTIIQTLPMRKDSFVSGQLLSVTVSFIENPSQFWCQLLDESDILNQLMEDIDGKISELFPMNSTQLTVGNYCIAQFSEDEAWYRAQIVSCEPENSYKVFFIDYGNSEEVSESQIKILPPEFMKYPPQCFMCNLQYTPSKLLPEMTTLFRDTVAEVEEITAKVENFSLDCCTVSLLFDKDDQELNVSELLFGVKEEICGSAITKEHPKFLPPDVPLGLHDGYVSTVNSPQDFFIQLSGSEEALSNLSAELASSSEFLAVVNPVDLSIGYACSSKYSEDNNWYRAEVISILDTTVDVLFVDYGNIDTVEKDTLKNLTDKLLEMPPMAMKCKLNGIVPVADEWSEEAINTFEDMVLESCLGITFISKDIPATVNIAKDDKEIAQCLVDMELANVESCTETDEAYAEDHLAPPIDDPLSSLPNDQSYPNRKLSSTKLIVKICYVDCYDKFYITPLELGTELDTVMTTLNILYASDDSAESQDSKSCIPDVLEDPKVSMPCVAKYSEDNAWYRAVITEVDGENIYVTFVDYGNSEITTLENLRPLTPELVKIPPIALECSLFGIEAAAGKEQEITAKLEEYFVDEVELEMEICEFSPYKIKLNYNGDVAAMFIKEGLAKEQVVIPAECETFVDNSKMTFVDESLEYRIQISKRFFTGVDKIVGNIKFCEIENDLVAFHVVSADLEDELQGLQQNLQDAYSEAPGNLANAAYMDFCAAKYMEDENWYRAQVLSCDKEKMKVRFIDYGNCETVDKSNIYELLPDFTIEPQFSVKCIPFGLKVNKSKEVELQNRLDDYVYHDSVELKLCKYPHATCDLCITRVVCGDTDVSEVIMNEMLVSQQYIVSTPLDHKFKATVQKIEGEVIYLLPTNLVDERNAFHHKMQEVCNNLDILSSDVHAHYLYAAKIDDSWHRVSVIDISGHCITVNLVDYGPTKVVDMSDLVLLPTDICHQPLFLQPFIVEAFGDPISDVKETDIQNLRIGSLISCELKKTYPLVQPFVVKILEINSNLDQSEIKISEVLNVKEKVVAVGDEQNQNKESSELFNIEQSALNESHVGAPDGGTEELVETESKSKGDMDNFEEEGVLKEKNIDELIIEDKNEFVETKFDISEDKNEHKTESEINEDKTEFQINEVEDKLEKTEFQINGDESKPIETEFEINEEENKPNETEFEINKDKNESSETEFEMSEDRKEFETEFQINGDKNESIETEFQISKDKNKSIEISEDKNEYIEITEDKNEYIEITEDNEYIKITEDKNESTDTEFKVSEDKNESIEIIEDKNESIETECKTEITEDKNQSIEISEDENEYIEISEDENEYIEISKDKNESIEISKDKNESIEITEDKNESIEISEDKNESIETEFKVSEDKNESIEVSEDKNESVEISEDKNESIEISEDKNESIEISEDKNESIEISEDKNESIETECKISEDKNESIETEFKVNENKNGSLKTEFDISGDKNEFQINEDENKLVKMGVNVQEENINQSRLEDSGIDTLYGGNRTEFIETKFEKVEGITELMESDVGSREKNIGESEFNAMKDESQKDIVDIKNIENKAKVDKTEGGMLENNITETEYDDIDCDKSSKGDQKEFIDPKFQTNENQETIRVNESTVSVCNSDGEIGNEVVSAKECTKFSDQVSLCKSDKDCDKPDSSDILNSVEFSENDQNLEGTFHLNSDYCNKNDSEQTVDFIENDPHKSDLSSDTQQNSLETSTSEHKLLADSVKNNQNENLDVDNSFEVMETDSCDHLKDIEQHFEHEGLVNSEDADKENNRGIEDSCQLSGSVQVTISDIAISDGSVIFAVQPLYLQEEFSLLKQSMQVHYSSKTSAYDESSSFCVVLHESEWSRGKILQSGEDICTVLLIDYGKWVSIDSSNVKNIDTEHSNVPPFAVWCTLASVICPPEKTETAKTFLSDKLKNTNAVIKILEGGEPYKINVFVDGTSVLNQLLKNSLVTQKLPNMYLEPESHKAKLSFLNVNSEIFVSLSSFSDDYSALYESMQSTYKIEDFVSNVVESSIYAAFYNNSWYRGLVVSSDNEIQVYLVDTGETISGCKKLCFLLPEHCLQPAYAIPCHIPFSSSHATNEISESISNILKATEFLVNIEVCPNTNAISATLIDEQVVSEVKNIGLTYDVIDSNSGEVEIESSSENSVLESNDTKLSLANSSSTDVKVEKKEASEHIVGYLEETFTTEPS